MDKRKGKPTKTMRVAGTHRKSIYDLDVLFEKFCSALIAENAAAKTVENHRNFFKYFLEYLDMHGIAHDVRNVTKDLVREYLAWTMREKVKFDGHKFKPESSKTKGLSASSANNRLKTLRVFFKFLEDEGIIEVNEIKEVKYVKDDENEPDILSEDEMRALLKAPDLRRWADFRDYVLMNVLIDCFSRINETLQLKWENVDLSQGLITFRAETTKVRKSRTVPISKRTSRLLAELKKENEDFDSEYVFLSNYGEPLTANHFRKRLKLHAKRAGITKRVHPHIFRHTSATMALEDGMDSTYLRLILGHTDDRSIRKYIHLSDRSIAEKHAKYTPLNRVYGKLNKDRKILRD